MAAKAPLAYRSFILGVLATVFFSTPSPSFAQSEECLATAKRIEKLGFRISSADSVKIEFTHPRLASSPRPTELSLGCDRMVLFGGWPARRAPKYFLEIFSKAASAILSEKNMLGPIERCHNSAAIDWDRETDNSSGTTYLMCQSGRVFTIAVRELRKP